MSYDAAINPGAPSVDPLHTLWENPIRTRLPHVLLQYFRLHARAYRIFQTCLSGSTSGTPLGAFGTLGVPPRLIPPHSVRKPYTNSPPSSIVTLLHTRRENPIQTRLPQVLLQCNTYSTVSQSVQWRRVEGGREESPSWAGLCIFSVIYVYCRLHFCRHLY